jgi:hypothetical protein
VMRPMARVRDFDQAVVFDDLRALVRFRVVVARLERFAIACTGMLSRSVPRAVASVLRVESRSLPLAVLIRTRI